MVGINLLFHFFTSYKKKLNKLLALPKGICNKSFYSFMLEHWRDKSNLGMTYVHTYNNTNIQILRTEPQGVGRVSLLSCFLSGGESNAETDRQESQRCTEGCQYSAKLN